MQYNRQLGISPIGILVIIVIIIVGGLVVYNASREKEETKKEQSEAMMEEKKDESMMKKDEAMEASGEKMMEKTDEIMKKVGEEMMNESQDIMQKPETKTFDLTGRNFAFSQGEIRVKKGATVKIHFQSTEGFHDWSLDGYNIKTMQVNPGLPTSVEFTADKSGSFEFFCSVGSHRALGMIGKLIVE